MLIDIAIKYPALMKWFNELSATNSCKKAIDQVVGEKGIDAFKVFNFFGYITYYQ